MEDLDQKLFTVNHSYLGLVKFREEDKMINDAEITKVE